MSYIDAERKRLLIRYKEQKTKREERNKGTHLFKNFVLNGDTKEAMKLLNAKKVDIKRLDQDVIDKAIEEGYVDIVGEIMKGKCSRDREFYVIRFMTKKWYPFNVDMLPSLILDEKSAKTALLHALYSAFRINKGELEAVLSHVSRMIVIDDMFMTNLIYATFKINSDCFHLVFDSLFISKPLLDSTLCDMHKMWQVSSVSTRVANMLISKGADISLLHKDFREEINKLELNTLMMGLHEKNRKSSIHKAFVQHDLSETRLINFITSF